MKLLLDRIKAETPKEFDFAWLGRFVRSIEASTLDYREHIPAFQAESGTYARNILCMEPFEVVMLHWPPGVESAIHHHKGFWGYVLCLEGEVENIEYAHDPDARELRELRSLRVREGGVLPEPDGTIHKITNPSKDKPLVTVHFYAPALETLDGMMLFDEKKGWLAELNAQATTASFNQDDQAFKRLERDAFTFIPISANPGQETHRLCPLIPKPSGEEIMGLLDEYYTEQAGLYDTLDDSSKKRSAYTAGIDSIIAADFASTGPNCVLHIACGTGRRAWEIRGQSGLSYKVEGVDISASMVQQARVRGVEAKVGSWNECHVPESGFDAITFLYAFGHIPSTEERRKSLLKVFRSLKPGGRFYFDVFNVENPKEWGPEAMLAFEAYNLVNEGYEPGDLFYKRHEGQAVAFLHYCTSEGIVELVEDCGFRVLVAHRIGYVDRPGESLHPTEEHGNLLIIAERPL